MSPITSAFVNSSVTNTVQLLHRFLYVLRGKDQLQCDGTRAETRLHLSAKRTSLFKLAGVGGPSVQLTTGSRGVRMRGSNAG